MIVNYVGRHGSVDQLIWRVFLESEGVPCAYISPENISMERLSKRVVIVGRDVRKATLQAIFQIPRVVAIGSQEQCVTMTGDINLKRIKGPFSRNNFSLPVNDEQHVEWLSHKSSETNGLFIGVENHLSELWQFSGAARKKLIVDWKLQAIASERLCIVSKRNLRRYMKHTLLMAHEHLGIPLIYYWKFPGLNKSVFNLRIDVDPDKNTSDKKALSKIRRCLDTALLYKDRVTANINFYKRTENFHFFKSYTENGMDIQSHNFLHALFPSQKLNKTNMTLADGLLRTAGVQPQGFCAPEYYWYNHVADIIEDLGYSFSNSLGFDFSNYPYRPVVNGQIRRYFEMPVDPLVLNHFSRAIGSDIETDLIPYYQSLLEAKCTQNGQPCLLYCHPAGEGTIPAIMETILTFVDSKEDVLPVTQSAWCDWLKQREAVVTRLLETDYYDPERIIVRFGSGFSQTDAIAFETSDGHVRLKYFTRDAQLMVGLNEVDREIDKHFHFDTSVKKEIGEDICGQDEIPLNRTLWHWRRLFNYFRSYCYLYVTKKLPVVPI